MDSCPGLLEESRLQELRVVEAAPDTAVVVDTDAAEPAAGMADTAVGIALAVGMAAVQAVGMVAVQVVGMVAAQAAGMVVLAVGTALAADMAVVLAVGMVAGMAAVLAAGTAVDIVVPGTAVVVIGDTVVEAVAGIVAGAKVVDTAVGVCALLEGEKEEGQKMSEMATPSLLAGQRAKDHMLVVVVDLSSAVQHPLWNLVNAHCPAHDSEAVPVKRPQFRGYIH